VSGDQQMADQELEIDNADADSISGAPQTWSLLARGGEGKVRAVNAVKLYFLVAAAAPLRRGGGDASRPIKVSVRARPPQGPESIQPLQEDNDWFSDGQCR